MNRILFIALFPLAACTISVGEGASTTGSGATAGTTSGSSTTGSSTSSGGVSCFPYSLNFGLVQVNANPAPTQRVTCTNTGATSVLMSVSATTIGAQFSVTDSNGPINSAIQQTLAPNGGTYVFSVTFEPTAVGGVTSSLTYTLCTEASSCAAAVPVALNGVGTATSCLCGFNEVCALVDGGTVCVGVEPDGGTCPAPSLCTDVSAFCNCADGTLSETGCSVATCDAACCGHGGAAESLACASIQSNHHIYPELFLFLVDASGSMCITDPPGSQGVSDNAVCETFCDNNPTVPGCGFSGSVKPQRVQALETILNQIIAQNTATDQPIAVAIVPFETNVFTDVWPTQLTFAPPDQTTLAYVDALPSELGNGADYQGAFAYAEEQLAVAMQSTSADALPGTTFHVVLIGGGDPSPVCTSTRTLDGGLPAADYQDSSPFTPSNLPWDDDPIDYCLEAVGQVDCGNGPETTPGCFQQPAGSPPGVTGYAFGTDRNQPYQLFDLIHQIRELKAQYDVGDVTFSALLAMNPTNVQLCGTACTDLYANFPNLAPTQQTAAAVSMASWLFSSLAQEGGGVFDPLVNGQLSSTSLVDLPLGPLGCSGFDAGPPSGCELSPGSANFTQVMLGVALSQAVTLKNFGTGTCDLSVALDPTSNSSFTLDPATPATLSIPAGAIASITVDFTLDNANPPNTRTGAIDVTSNGGPLTLLLMAEIAPVTNGGYTIVTLDPTAPPATEFAMAISATDQIGVVYYRDGGGQAGGLQNQAVTYTEVAGGAVTISPETINIAQLQAGLTISFPPGDLPAVGYLGGRGGDGGTYWLQSQAEIDYRVGPGSWQKDLCMLDSMGGSCAVGQAACNVTPGSGGPFDWKIYDGTPPTEDLEAEQLCDNPNGTVVGLWPSLIFDGGTALMAVRDVHEGQFPLQDYSGSDAKLCIGGPGGSNWSWSAPLTISASGSHTANGFGVHNQLVYANGLLAEIADSDPKDQGTEASGSGPITFTIQTGSNTQSNADWTAPIDPFNPFGQIGAGIENPGTGPSMVYGDALGFGVAAVDLSTATPSLYYTASTDGQTWRAPEVVYSLGSGGFFPALAINPNTGNPIVSYTICSLQPGASPQPSGPNNPECLGNSCGVCTSDAELDVAERSGSTWSATTIVKGNFWHPRFGYLSTGKKVFVYSDLVNGGLYAAVEN